MENDLQQLSDEELRAIIVDEQIRVDHPDLWKAAYTELFVDRYGGIVKYFGWRFGPQNLELGTVEDLHGPLLEYLRGDGSWRHLCNWDPQIGPFGPWLYPVVRNLCKARLTQEQRHAARQSSLHGSRGDAAGEALPWDELIRDPSWEREEEYVLWEMLVPLLKEALERLDPKDQGLLFDSFWLVLTDGEIGKRLGQRRETVNKKKNEAVRKLLYLLTAGYHHHLDKTSQDVLRRYYHDGETEHRISQTLKLTDEEVSQRRLAALITLQDIIKGDLPND